MIARIHWTDDLAGNMAACTGYVGTLDPAMFHIWRPDAHCAEWQLTTRLHGMEQKHCYGDDPDELKAEAERWLEEFTSSLGAVFPDEPDESHRKPRTELDGYRPYHAADCPARTSYHGHVCTCGGLEHPLWKPGDEPTVHAEPVDAAPSAPGGAGKE